VPWKPCCPSSSPRPFGTQRPLAGLHRRRGDHSFHLWSIARDASMGLGPTHESCDGPSRRPAPFPTGSCRSAFIQIQDKIRDEIRPRFRAMRARNSIIEGA